jgi:mandelate racemase
MPRDSSPTIQEFRVRTVRVPMTEPHQTASGVITESPLVLTDVITDSGISYLRVTSQANYVPGGDFSVE